MSHVMSTDYTNKVEVRTGRSQGPNVIADDRYTLAVTLFFLARKHI